MTNIFEIIKTTLDLFKMSFGIAQTDDWAPLFVLDIWV